MEQYFLMYAAYNRWANDRVYEAAAGLTDDELNRNTGVFFKSVLGTLNHILVADRIWLKRFTGTGAAPTALDATIASQFTKLQTERRAEDARIINWIAGLDARAFAGRFTYVTVSDMRTISQRLAPALVHFFNHQTHHRGQVHGSLTALGKPSLQLDMIFFQRTEEGRQFA